jgi:hypothetical protein
MSAPIIKRTDTDNRQTTLTLQVSKDLDNDVSNPSFADIEVFRKKGEGDYQYLKTVSVDPQDVIGTPERIDFVDDGIGSGGTANDLETVDVESCEVITEVQDRIVKANVEYPERSVATTNDFTITLADEPKNVDAPMIPSKTNVQLFARSIFKDGQKSFHYPVSEPQEVNTNFKNLEVTGTPFSPEGVDSTNLYLSIEDQGDDIENADKIPFESLEIYNSNIPSLNSQTTDVPFYENRPHVFVGWKYIMRSCAMQPDPNDNTKSIAHITDSVVESGYNQEDLDPQDALTLPTDSITVQELQVSIDEHWDTVKDEDWSEYTDVFPDQMNVGGQLNGTPYSKYATGFGVVISDLPDEDFDHAVIGVYILTYADALKKAVSSGNVKLQLSESTSSRFSSRYNKNVYIDSIEDVEFIMDESEGENIDDILWELELESSDNYQPYQYYYPDIPRQNKIYAVLPIDSVYSDIDTREVQNVDMLASFSDGEPTVSFPHSFEFIGVDYELGTDNFGENFEESIHDETSEVRIITLTRGLQSNVVISTLQDENFLVDNLIFVGNYYDSASFNRLTDVSNKLKHTGFGFQKDGPFEFISLNGSNIYENRLLKQDVNLLDDKFPNQIVWSQPTVTGGSVSGSRQFLYTSFLDVSSEYGSIIDLASVRNNLLVFCERGVALIKVGEQLASSPSGNVYVTSSQFLSQPYWILKSSPYVQKYTIAEYENSIYFSDGSDLWSFGDGLKNVTKGSINMDGFCVGGIDPENKEYRLTVFNQPREGVEPVYTSTNIIVEQWEEGVEPVLPVVGRTYSFSLEIGEWSGPHSYGAVSNINRSNEMISFVGDQYAVQNVGNKFGDTPYTTVIESVANLQGEPNRSKRYRKFYLDAIADDPTEVCQFAYASEYFQNEYEVDLADRRTIRGTYPVGVRAGTGRPSTSRSFFWRITSVVKGFLLRSLSFDYLYKRK